MNQPAFIPVNEPLLNGNEEKYLVECIAPAGFRPKGRSSSSSRSRFAARVGRKHGVAVCNGSVALDAAVAALGIGPGDEVILPTFTIISCAAAIVRAGAVPVLVDSDPATWNMDVAQIEARITPRTKAIMVVHIYGLPVDMDPVLALAQQAWPEGHRGCRRDAWPDLQGQALRQLRRHQHLQLLPQQAHHHRRRRHDRDRRSPHLPRDAVPCAISVSSRKSVSCMTSWAGISA